MSKADATIALQGLVPVQKREENSTLSAPGAIAQGYALAQSAIAEIIGQHGAMNRYVGRLVELSTEARASFMKEINKHLKDMREHVQARADTPEHVRYKKIAATARTKFSELLAIVKALDAGYVVSMHVNPDNGVFLRDARGILQPLDPFTTIVADARIYLESQGAKDGRGRKAKPWLDKLKAFILNNQPEFADQLDDSVQLVQSLAELTKHAQQ